MRLVVHGQWAVVVLPGLTPTAYVDLREILKALGMMQLKSTPIHGLPAILRVLEAGGHQPWPRTASHQELEGKYPTISPFPQMFSEFGYFNFKFPTSRTFLNAL